MSMTKVQVISNALTLLGKKPILSLDGAGDLVVAAEQAFDFLFPASLAEIQWRFACKIVMLNQLVAIPVPVNTPAAAYYTVAYDLPPDFLKTIRVYPQNYAWEIFENRKIYSNMNSPMQMEYLFMPIITTVPMYFWKYFVYELAAYLSLSSAQQPEWFSAMESKRQIQFGIAASIDAQNRPTTPMVQAPMLDARQVSAWVQG